MARFFLDPNSGGLLVNGSDQEEVSVEQAKVIALADIAEKLNALVNHLRVEREDRMRDL